MTRAHVVLFPFMAKGHTIPLLYLSTALTRRGVAVTVLTTPANSPFIERFVLPNPAVHLVDLPFPVDPALPDGCESTDQLPSNGLFVPFIRATQRLEAPFRAALRRMSAAPGNLPLCVVSDFFLWWTNPVCAELGVPRIVFHGMGVFSLFTLKSLWREPANLLLGGNGGNSFRLPGVPESYRLTEDDLPNSVSVPGDPLADVIDEIERAEPSSWGLIVNSFAGLEGRIVPLLRRFYTNPERIWLVGPLSSTTAARGEQPEWLDGKPAGSVLYASFGTQAEVSGEQLDEIAHGLEASGHPYLWVVRSPAWSPPAGTGQKGLVARGWVPQSLVLRHLATGGFLSHCGWNSVLESVAAGVPILAWPMMAEQKLNAKVVAEQLGNGVRLPTKRGGGLVGRAEICGCVRELMEGAAGEKARKRAAELAEKAAAAVAPGGSSVEAVDTLVKQLPKISK